MEKQALSRILSPIPLRTESSTEITNKELIVQALKSTAAWSTLAVAARLAIGNKDETGNRLPKGFSQPEIQSKLNVRSAILSPDPDLTDTAEEAAMRELGVPGKSTSVFKYANETVDYRTDKQGWLSKLIGERIDTTRYAAVPGMSNKELWRDNVKKGNFKGTLEEFEPYGRQMRLAAAGKTDLPKLPPPPSGNSIVDTAFKKKNKTLTAAAILLPLATVPYVWHKVDEALKERERKRQQALLDKKLNKLDKMYYEEYKRTRGLDKESSGGKRKTTGLSWFTDPFTSSGRQVMNRTLQEAIPSLVIQTNTKGDIGFWSALGQYASKGAEAAMSGYTVYGSLALAAGYLGAKRILDARDPDKKRREELKQAIAERARVKEAPQFELTGPLLGRSAKGPDTVKALPARSSLEPLRLPAGQKEIAI